MNSAFLRFRLRQFEKFIREIPVIYLILLTGILLIAGIFKGTERGTDHSRSPAGSFIAAAIAEEGLSFHFTCGREGMESVLCGLFIAIAAGYPHFTTTFLLV